MMVSAEKCATLPARRGHASSVGSAGVWAGPLPEPMRGPTERRREMWGTRPGSGARMERRAAAKVGSWEVPRAPDGPTGRERNRGGRAVRGEAVRADQSRSHSKSLPCSGSHSSMPGCRTTRLSSRATAWRRVWAARSARRRAKWSKAAAGEKDSGGSGGMLGWRGALWDARAKRTAERQPAILAATGRGMSTGQSMGQPVVNRREQLWKSV